MNARLIPQDVKSGYDMEPLAAAKIDTEGESRHIVLLAIYSDYG